MPAGCFLTAFSFYSSSICNYPAINRSFSLSGKNGTNGKYRASLIMDPQSFEVGRLIGSYGFMNVTSYSGFQSQLEDVGGLKFQDVNQGNVQIRLYEGRVTQGPRRGTPIIFKVYPGKQVGGLEADMMASNELKSHAFLQSSSQSICQNIQILLGGFETRTGEQWLAFRNDGKYSAADYAKASSEKLSKNRAPGEQKFWNPFEESQYIKQKRIFIIKLLQGALCGLAYMHDKERLHQSLGPASVVLNTMADKEAVYLVPRLRDLAFSVDIQFSSLEESPSGLSEGLWRRARSAGAFTPMEKRAFGIADDIYGAGLLFAYLAFIPFCEAGIIDSLSLQRLLESTFKLDLAATREYCLADDRFLEAVKFLDMGDGAGWELLQAMLNPDFRNRPIAEAVVNHRFLTGALL
ncbi:protein kinase superfamily protein [Artemisia annua]|uniref:Protein kinase superfamily protein n=1 Tax=Artemisia annua TaxID=35608 RepID=A0A2U1LHG7_ARTAN|nr:protein kinase superfamily protein [Artemisia annua]